MHLLLVNLYEFGLFLRILLWISVPLIVVTLLVTTWLHYRSRHRAGEELTLSMEGMDITADPADLLAAIQGRSLSVGAEEAEGLGGADGYKGTNEKAEDLSERERNRMYKGILWMKEKYEQYRDLADQRIEQLKNELVRSEQRYRDLLDQRTKGGLPDEVERPPVDGVERPPVDGVERLPVDGAERPPVDEVAYSTAAKVGDSLPAAPEQDSPEVINGRESLLEERGRLLEEKDRQLESRDRQIEELQGQLQKQWRQTEELVSKLHNSSQLLLKISRELDGSVPPADRSQLRDEFLHDPQAQAEAQPS
ncbi:MAG: hypothetical protein JST42_23425 [Bacteroidetes bacterium]|nr:hypothetical protein [Bacteroidota bacterium]